ncbi:hypothetical protein DEU56DRAFT_761685 [Suillus clintonianus]|uniref:uncharacterized protein n=1 Tax=Suillus clintonianus TaxID=1904413 RepID=UPI001B875A24|nr:uncharacterized protein DEU56DRAFT_761685 [Suillus clintonianus]KAG2115496.1 hypothetical protein DEU56DRAFT_761685 [Suillus clintonianus]
MGNRPSKSRSQSTARAQFGDFSVENVKGSKSSLAGNTSGNDQSAPPPYTTSATSPASVSSENDTEASQAEARAAYLRQPLRAESMEDALETLRQYDTIIIMDDSSSMRGSLWKEAKQALAELVEVASQYDANGVDIYFLNHYGSMTEVTDPKVVHEKFANLKPNGATPIGHRLEAILGHYFRDLDVAKRQEDAGDYLARKKIKPVNMVIITDGQPTDDPESVIVSFAKRLDVDKWPLAQVGIQFVQIGNSKGATKFLVELDDNLNQKHKIRDIVDTTPYMGEVNAEMLIKVLLGGINRRVDKQGAAAVM